jgi:hypothetical protein
MPFLCSEDKSFTIDFRIYKILCLAADTLRRCGQHPFRMLDKPHNNRPMRVASLKQEGHFSADLTFVQSYCRAGQYMLASRIGRKIDQGLTRSVEAD